MALFTGFVLVTTGGKVVVNLVVYGAANPFPWRSVILFECSTTINLVPAARSELGVIDSTLPSIDDLNGIAVPVLDVTNSIHGFVPNLMFLLKVICITLFKATLTALFTGFVLVTTGGVVVVNLVVYGAANPFPWISVILFECSTTINLVPAARSESGIIDSTLPSTVVVNGVTVPLFVLSSIHGLVPSLMFSLKFICITLFKATLTALFTGSVLVTTGERS